MSDDGLIHDAVQPAARRLGTSPDGGYPTPTEEFTMPRSGWQDRPGPSTAVGKTAKWKRLRRNVLRRDGGQCQVHGPRCADEAAEVHHVLPIARGGDEYDEDNCVSICRPCHAMLSGQETAARHLARSGRRAPRTHPADVAGNASTGL
jgi:5-methylcytosine-specific restriction protein A